MRSVLKVIISNMFLWRHLETNSNLLFKGENFSALIMKNFPARHGLHLLVLLLKAAAEVRIVHLIFKHLLLSKAKGKRKANLSK